MIRMLLSSIALAVSVGCGNTTLLEGTVSVSFTMGEFDPNFGRSGVTSLIYEGPEGQFEIFLAEGVESLTQNMAEPPRDSWPWRDEGGNKVTIYPGSRYRLWGEMTEDYFVVHRLEWIAPPGPGSYPRG